MTCETFRFPDGGVAIICSPRQRRRKCSVAGCTEAGTRQCDYRLGSGRDCDKHLCAGHAVKMGDDVDFCPDHPRQPDLPVPP